MLGILLLFDSLAWLPEPQSQRFARAGTLDPNFVPCLGVLQGFAGNDSNSAPRLWLQRHRARRNPLPVNFWFGGSQKIRSAQHAAMESHRAALSRT